jgi:hypothetical protein
VPKWLSVTASLVFMTSHARRALRNSPDL